MGLRISSCSFLFKMSWHGGRIWTKNNNCNSNGQLRKGAIFYIYPTVRQWKNIIWRGKLEMSASRL
jgi:hypothetical protein